MLVLPDLLLAALESRTTQILSVNRIVMLRTLLLFACTLLLANAFVPHRHTGGIARGYADIESRKFNFFENIGSMISNFGKKATASHILIGPKTMNQGDARKKLEEIKAAVGNDPEKFAKYATEFSTCPSAKNGGDLGSFGPGMMVKNFDRVSAKASLRTLITIGRDMVTCECIWWNRINLQIFQHLRRLSSHLNHNFLVCRFVLRKELVSFMDQ